MANFIVGGVILILFAAASMYLYKEKKRGVKCIGCPSAQTCASRCNGMSECCLDCYTE